MNLPKLWIKFNPCKSSIYDIILRKCKGLWVFCSLNLCQVCRQLWASQKWSEKFSIKKIQFSPFFACRTRFDTIYRCTTDSCEYKTRELASHPGGCWIPTQSLENQWDGEQHPWRPPSWASREAEQRKL